MELTCELLAAGYIRPNRSNVILIVELKLYVGIIDGVSLNRSPSMTPVDCIVMAWMPL